MAYWGNQKYIQKENTSVRKGTFSGKVKSYSYNKVYSNKLYTFKPVDFPCKYTIFIARTDSTILLISKILNNIFMECRVK